MDLASVLRRAGLKVVENRVSAAPGTFAPVGIILHHTAGRDSLKTVMYGRPGIPGPLCNLLLDPDGTWHLITDGKANDSGLGSGRVLDEVRSGKRVTKDAGARGLNDTVNGNAYFYDIEVEHIGTHGVYPKGQLTSLARGVAALLLAAGWSDKRVIHHRQWTRRKIDMSYKGDIWKAIRTEMEAMSHKTLQVGDRGKDVAKAQRRLVAHGFAPKGWFVKLRPGYGKFDDAMKSKVKTFQRAHGLEADGIIGPQTWQRLLRKAR